MKNSTAILLAILLGLCSCKSEDGQGEPILWYLYAQIQTTEERDYFEVNEDYKFEKFRVCWAHNIETTCAPQIDYPESYSERDNMVVFNIGKPSENELLFDFGNGDVDTISYRWEPKSVFPDGSLSNVEYIDVYFNGAKAYRFDFEKNEPSRWDLTHRNSGYPSFPDDPIIIPIVKGVSNGGN